MTRPIGWILPLAMNEPEYVGRRVPPRLYLCGRCKRGVLVFLGIGDETLYEPTKARPRAWCFVCGSKGDAKYEYMLVLRGSDEGAVLQAGVPTVRVHERLQ